MQLVSIDIENFRVLRSTHIDFPDAVLGIIGLNGSGKSSIVEAVSWVLYGNTAARSSKDEIKSTYADASDTCRVVLEFVVRGERYRVERRLVGKTDRPEAELWQNDSAIAHGVSDVQQGIERVLGLDLKGFETSFLARQQELNALSDLTAAKRREHLAGMLGIERLDRAIKAAKEDVKTGRETVGFLERQVERRGELEQRRKQIAEHISQHEQGLAEAVGARDRAKKSLDEITGQYREHEAKRDVCSRINADIRAESATAKHLAEHAESTQKSVTELEKARGQIEDLRKQAEKLAGSVEAHQKLGEARAKVERRDELRGQLKETEAEIDDLDKRRDNLAADHKQVEQQLADLPATITEQLETKRNERDNAREQFSHIKGDLGTARNDLKRLDEQIKSIEQIGPDTVCDRCHRPFGDDLPAIKKHLHDERAQVSERAAELERQLREIEARGKELSAAVTKLEAKAAERVRVVARHEATVKELDNVAKQLKTLTVRRDKIGKQLGEIGEVEFDQKAFKRLAADVKAHEEVTAKINRLTGRVENLDDTKKELANSQKKLAATREKINTLEAERDKIGFDEAAFKATAKKLEDARRAFERERDRAGELDTKIKVARTELKNIDEQLSQLSEHETELEKRRKDLFHGERLVRLFGDYRKHVIANIRPRLAELTSELLGDMTAGRYTMAELDEDYELSLLDAASYFGIDRFSGGERDLANLCLRLAISQALTESAGLERSFVILDEVFGSQDDERRDLIFDGLVTLKQRFPQMVLITHIDDIKHKVEALIEVERTPGGWSEVRFNGEKV